MNLDESYEVDELPAPPRKQLDPADFELLVLASRALGAVRVEVVEGEQWVNLHFEDGSTMFGWNPLRHSDDTFNLAVDLGMRFYADHERGIATAQLYDYEDVEQKVAEDFDIRAATRLAVTRAAAEVGKQRS